MISIVIPALNEKRYIGKLLDSILAQELSESIEVIVADAHSTDGTRDVVNSYGTRLDIKIVDGGMPAIARNNGAKASSGDPIFFIDADLTLPDPQFLQKNLDYFRRHHLAIAATPLIPDSTHRGDYFLVGFYSHFFMPLMQHISPFGAMCVVASREAFQKTGGYPEGHIMNEDHDFVQACWKVGPYGILPVASHFSVRRMEKEGRFGLAWKYTYATMYRLFVGPIRRPLFSYEFAHKDPEHTTP